MYLIFIIKGGYKMETRVLMKRELFGEEIAQNNLNSFFSATDLVRAGNKWRVANNLPFFNLATFLQTKETKERSRTMVDSDFASSSMVPPVSAVSLPNSPHY